MRATKDMIAQLIRVELAELRQGVGKWDSVWSIKEDFGPEATCKGDPLEKAILKLARLRELRWEWAHAPDELTLGNRP